MRVEKWRRRRKKNTNQNAKWIHNDFLRVVWLCTLSILTHNWARFKIADNWKCTTCVINLYSFNAPPLQCSLITKRNEMKKSSEKKEQKKLNIIERTKIYSRSKRAKNVNWEKEENRCQDNYSNYVFYNFNFNCCHTVCCHTISFCDRGSARV